MRSKGCDNASTIHSLIYRAREDPATEQPSFELKDDGAGLASAKLIVIDECSMVDAELGRDLMSFGKPLLVLGDPAQLPPIQGGGFFTDAEPDVMLTEVHRQAQDDPIVRMSMDVREGRELDIGGYGESEVVRARELDPERVMEADQVLVGRNNTRRAYNMRMRAEAGYRGSDAGGRRQAGLPAQQPQEGPVQRRAVAGEVARPRRSDDHHACGCRPTRIRRDKVTKVGARRSSRATRETCPWERRKLRRVRLRLRAHRAQVAGLAMGRRGAVRRELCVPRAPRALALHRHHPRGEAADAW